MISNPEISGLPEELLSFDIGIVPNHFRSNRDPSVDGIVSAIDQAAHRDPRPLSKWSASLSKRLFDIGCVLLSLPVTLPAFLLSGLAVRLTSSGPVLFKQQRMGAQGGSFTIYKFRTMPVRRSSGSRPIVTTAINQRFTPVGPFLRGWKLDELPQLFNVLRGDMSLVGPRPKVLSHQSAPLSCRPGVTGRATIVFAREEITLASIPLAQLDSYYHGVVLPLKQILDDEYMAIATFASDLKLLLHSVLRKWDDLQLSDLLPATPEPAHARDSVRLEIPHKSGVLMAAQKAMTPRPD
jgi:lipopolysaccharide/colanic/teichoic acid biosynthesis glycosyltransferase